MSHKNKKRNPSVATQHGVENAEETKLERKARKREEWKQTQKTIRENEERNRTIAEGQDKVSSGEQSGAQETGE